LKIAVSSQGQGLDAESSPIFGRCPFFVIAEVEGEEVKEIKSLQNTAVGQAGGAGISAAQLIGNEGVEAIVTGAMGPRAFGVMNELGIKVFVGNGGSIEKSVIEAASGKLQELSMPGPMGSGGKPTTGAGFGAGQGRGAGAGQGRGMGAGRRGMQ